MHPSESRESGLNGTILNASCKLFDSAVPDVPGVEASNGRVFSGTPIKSNDVLDVPVHVPAEADRPCFKVFDDWLTLADKSKSRPGVYYFGRKEAKDGTSGLNQPWICAPITYRGRDL